MRQVSICMIAIFAAGCFSLTKSTPSYSGIPVQRQHPDVRDYGVGIIRLGMSQIEVETLLGTGMNCHFGGGQFVPHYQYHQHGISIRYTEFINGVVASCEVSRPTITGVSATLDDKRLAKVLCNGMSAFEVEQKIGVPKCGFENEPGAVHLIYPQPGIEVIYMDGKLKSWRRSHTYLDAATTKDEK